MANLQQTINWAQTFIQYSPLTAGLGMEPAVSIASMVRTSILNPPLTWFFNRNETTFSTVVGQQDYTENISDFAFLEKATLTDDQGNIWEIKDVYNNATLALTTPVGLALQRPSAISVETGGIVSSNQQFKFRFQGVPDKIYTVTLTYQKLAPQFGPFFISAVGNAVGSDTTYTGNFDPISFPTGAIAVVTGLNTPNNGSFTVVSCSFTSLVLVNAAGTAQSGATGYVSNLDWSPIPDQYSDVYNNLFLSEAMAAVDDARAQTYRSRGVAALMAKATGLTEMQKNAFAQQWLMRGAERQALAALIQLGNAGRGV